MTNLDNVQQLMEYLVVKNVMVADENGGLPEYVTEEYWSKNKDSMVSSDEHREGSKPTGMTRKSTGKTPMIQIVLKMTGERIIQKNEEDNRAKFYKFYLQQFRVNKVGYESVDDFTQTFTLKLFEACVHLDELEDLEALLNDEMLYNTRMKYIKRYISEELKKENVRNGNYEHVSTTDENGKRVNVIVGLDGISGKNTKSINELIPNSEGENVELSDMLNDYNNLYSDKGEAKYNHFLTWFLNNKEDILTKSQLNKYNTLKDIYTVKYDNSRKSNTERGEMYLVANITKSQFNQFRKNVKNRTTKAYEQEFDNFNRNGFSTDDRKLAVDIFKGYVEEADNSTKYFTAEDRQVELSEYVAKYYDDYEEFEIVITRGLSVDEKKEIVRTVLGKQLLSHKVIRMINNNIKVHLETVREVKPAQQEWEGYSERALNGVLAENGNIVSINSLGALINTRRQDRSGVHYDEYRRDIRASECKVYCYECYKKGKHVPKFKIVNEIIDERAVKGFRYKAIASYCHECDKGKEVKYFAGTKLIDENSNIVDLTEEMANKLSLLLCKNLIQEGDITNE